MGINLRDVNAEQIGLMLHALGGPGTITNPYRNYYNSGETDDQWEELVLMGLATKLDKGSWLGGVCYYCSRKGIRLIQQILAS